MGNIEGHSSGYQDRQQSTAPDQHRFMTKQDYSLRSALGNQKSEK